ncbi:MAG TPA: hypothetical protein PLF13_11815 [candidate division Zixibacteria bacterium]|nr:hypothetical protein [candidate division Zixibacteria bacterium]
MNMKLNKKMTLLVVVILIAATMIGLAILAGCTKTVDGDVNANQKPIVYFVNIPPEGQEFSRNPVIYWVGTDRDGLISYFRYYVATAAEIGTTPLASFAETIPADSWIRLDVEPKGPDPQTTNVVSMSADLSDPVRTYIDQYVFLQAFDEEGLGSDIVYRMFSRNDNPPNTLIYGIATADLPFINAKVSGGAITGVKLRWYGEDPIDYPSDPPAFEYHWRLYGPYTDDQIALINSDYFDKVYVTNDGLIYEVGDTIISCDTVYQEEDFVEECDTIIVTADLGESAYGSIQSRFNVTDPEFIAAGLDMIASESNNGSSDDDSVWVLAESDTLYNVYDNFDPGDMDTTVLMNFVFWVRSRDDASVPDLVPAYKEFQVIDPRYERDIAVLEFNTTARTKKWNEPYEVSPGGVYPEFSKKMHFQSLVNHWSAKHPSYEIVFDTIRASQGILSQSFSAPDYFLVKRMYDNTEEGLPVSELLKHKMLILYNDDVGSNVQEQYYDNIYKAIDAGINVWATMRLPVDGGGQEAGILDIVPSAEYTWYFGVERTAFTGWVCMAAVGSLDVECEIGGLFQDFIGGISLDESVWPDFPVDTTLLHQRYTWTRALSGGAILELWSDENKALPEVNWSQTAYGTEVLYLYRSCYGQSHPANNQLAFQGRPVAHRYETSLFRTVHFNFTTPGMDSAILDSVSGMIFDWLYDPTLGTGNQQVNGAPRYNNAPVMISADEARENADQRTREIEAREGRSVEVQDFR